MEISISPQTKKLIEEASKKLNINSEAIISIAVRSYLENTLDPELKAEFEVWDKESDEALENFEKSL